MRLATYLDGPEQRRLGLVLDEHVADLTAPLAEVGLVAHDVGELLRADPDLTEARSVVESLDPAGGLPLEELTLLPPVTWPRKIMCVAANYKEHIEETGTIDYLPRHEASPWFFQKPVSSLNGHRAPIRLPALSEKVDWEVELGVVIGRGGRDIAESDAAAHVAGYTVVNDISAREITIPHRKTVRDRDRFHDWLHGKWFDTFCCVGPWLVTPDEIPDPRRLRLGCEISGRVYQDSDTSHMIFTIAELISFVSQIVTLEPGDLIATGTPSGVGKASGTFLKDGDTVRSWVDGIGVLENPVTG